MKGCLLSAFRTGRDLLSGLRTGCHLMQEANWQAVRALAATPPELEPVYCDLLVLVTQRGCDQKL